MGWPARVRQLVYKVRLVPRFAIGRSSVENAGVFACGTKCKPIPLICVKVEDGYISPSGKPGLGIEVDEEVTLKHSHGAVDCPVGRLPGGTVAENRGPS